MIAIQQITTAVLNILIALNGPSPLKKADANKEIAKNAIKPIKNPSRLSQSKVQLKIQYKT